MIQLPAWILSGGDLLDSGGQRRSWLVAGALILLAALLSLSLIIPGRSFSTDNTWDLMVLFDGAQRFLNGQVPNRDFHTPFGPLTYLLLSGGYWLSGTLGGTMPIMTGLFVLLLLPPLLYTCASRLPWPLALAFGIHILILSIAPALTGHMDLLRPTFGMYYNRFGWALLSLLVLFALPRREPFGRVAIDAVAMAMLLSMMLYLKISYGAVAGAFLLGLVAFPHMRRAALGAMLVSALVLVIVELFWSQTLAHLADVRAAAAASGPFQGGLRGLAITAANNMQGLSLFAGVLLLGLVQGIRLDYLLICLFVAGAGLFVANQNFQGPGILTLIPAALVVLLAPRPLRSEDRNLSPLPGILLIGALAIPPAFVALTNQAIHVAVASRGSNPGAVSIQGLITLDTPQSLAGAPLHGCKPINAGVPKLASVRGPEPLKQGQYLAIVQDGLTLLEGSAALSGKVFTFDWASPFNSLLRRGSLVGGNHWYHANRTFSTTSHPPPSEALGDADVVMVPGIAVEYATFDQLRSIYGRYLLENYELKARSDCWDAYVKRTDRRSS